MNVNADKDILKRYLDNYSPSGQETPAVKAWDEYISMYKNVNHCYTDKIGNSAWSVGNGPIKILLSGHIDEVQARVSHISKDGIISMISTGGPDRKSFIASHIVVLGDNGPIDGIVEKTAIHCEESSEREKVEDIYKLRVNVGCETDEDVKSLGIHIGSPIVYARNTNLDFGKNQICSQGLDDKIGVFIVTEIMTRLIYDYNEAQSGHFPSFGDIYTVIGLAATQEETGCRGAAIAAAAINPDISIDFDVTFATDGESGLCKGRYGDIALGKGGVIQFGPDKSERLNKILMDVCNENKLDFQCGATRAGGTNTNQIQLRSVNCETTLVSIPNRNMHSPVEVCDWRDVQMIVDMISKTIMDGKI